jgi:exosome complex component RRP42
MMMEILDEVKKDFVRDLVKKGRRPDERAFEEYRKAKVEQGVIPAAEGSARVFLGQTQVLVGVKMGIGTPFADRPEEGVLSTNAELLPMASPTFEPGPPSPTSIELARVVDRGIRSANTIDLKSLFIEEGKVWMTFVDVYVIDHDGNLIDAGALAAAAALRCARMPKYEDGKIVHGEYSGPLKLGTDCVACTFAKIGSALLLDPSFDEEIAMDARLTVATTPDHVCAMQKGASGGFTRDEISNMIDVSFRKGAELRALL